MEYNTVMEKSKHEWGGKRDGAGRKPLDASRRRRHRINVRFTAAEYERLQAEAREHGLELAVFLHKLITERG